MAVLSPVKKEAGIEKQINQVMQVFHVFRSDCDSRPYALRVALSGAHQLCTQERNTRHEGRDRWGGLGIWGSAAMTEEE
jgi:hypothetical protein